MITFLRNIFISLAITTASLPAFCEETIWLRGTFKEINTSSPVVGEATFPLELTRAVIAATPPKFLEEAMLSGFDIPVLFQSVEAMPVGETFELNKEEYQLRIEKFAVNEPEPKESRLMLIHLEEPNGTTKIPVPLALTSTAIPLLQLALKELNGMEDQLAKLIEEVRKTTPGLILTGQDKLMYTKLDIKLQ